MYIRLCVRMYVYVYEYVYMYTYMCVRVFCMLARTHAYTHAHLRLSSFRGGGARPEFAHAITLLIKENKKLKGQDR